MDERLCDHLHVADTLYADVSEWQTAVNDSYPHPVLCIRSNDGTYLDKKWGFNYPWCRDSGRLTFFIVYFVWRENWWDAVAALKSQVGLPPATMAVMMDVESWGGQITGNHSEGINAAFEEVAAWIGDRRRVIGYGNQGDLDTLWPQRPAGVQLVVAKYSTERPNYPGQIAHQYTDGQGYGTGPQGSTPFGNCDMNYAYNLTPEQFAAALGLTGGPPVGEKVLSYDSEVVPQETGYWCGPASAQVCLNIRGQHVSEQTLAAECGTDTGGTDYVGLIENCLDPRLPEANYTSVDAPHDPPTADEKTRLWDGIKRSIDNGYGVIMNWVAPPSNYPVGIKGSQSPSYGGGTVFHYVTCAGYDDAGARALWIADSGFSPFEYWISFDQAATLIPPKAACYANLPHVGTTAPPSPLDYSRLGYEQLCGPVDPATGYGSGWPQLGQNGAGQDLYVVDALSEILHLLEGGKKKKAAARATPAGTLDYTALEYEQMAGPRGVDGYGHGWAQLGGRSITDAIAHIKNVLSGGAATPPFR